MTKALWALLIIAMVCLSFLPAQVGLAAGGQEQLLMGGSSLTYPPSVSAVRYATLQGGYSWEAFESDGGRQLISTAGTIKDLVIKVDTAPGAGKKYTFALMVNGVAKALSVEISDAETQDSDMVHTVAVVAGDYVSIRSTPSGTPTTPGGVHWSSIFLGDTANESLIMGLAQTSKTTSYYSPLMNDYSYGATDSGSVNQIIPTGGVIKNLYIKQVVNAGTSGEDAYTYTLYLNNNPTALTVTVLSPATTGSDTAHEVAVVAGDRVCLLSTPVHSPTQTDAVSTGMTFVATTANQSIVLGGGTDPPTNAQVEYNTISTRKPGEVWSTTETNFLYMTQTPFILSNLYVRASGTEAGATTLTIRHAGANTTVIATIAAGQTTGSDVVNHYDTVDYELINMAVLSGGGTRYLYFGFICTWNPNTAPLVTTEAADNLSYLSATLHGTVTSTGGVNPTIRGFKYGKTSGALDLDWHEHGDFIAESFSWATGDILENNVTYYVQAYATNTIGTGLGVERSFTTVIYGAPIVTLQDTDGIGETAATAHGNITAIYGSIPTIVGFRWGIEPGNYTGNWTEEGTYPVGTTFSYELGNLTPNQLYFIQSFATNSGGTGYSAEGNFTTLLPLPEAPFNLVVTSASAGGIGNITLSWGKGLWAENTVIVIGNDFCPGSMMSGYELYGDDGITFTYSALGLDVGLQVYEYCIQAWSTNATGNSTGYAEVKIGGEEMAVIGTQLTIIANLMMYLSLPALLLVLSIWKRNITTIIAGIFASIAAMPFIADKLGAWMLTPLILIVVGLGLMLARDAWAREVEL